MRLFESFRDYEISPRTWASEVREMILGERIEEAQEACRLLWDNDLGDEIPQVNWYWIDELFVDRNFKSNFQEEGPIWDHDDPECGCPDCCEARDFFSGED